ncbi:probable aquaporin SIP2-1 isoform X1 [Nymphaea colorata]|nr:probable aquaporin SIP2-1 isoform X1 [Nymphaea colorata]
MPPLARSRPRTAIPARRLLQFPMEKLLLVSADLSISFMWVWAGALTKLFVYQVLGLGHHPGGELVKGALYLCVLFFFAWLGKASRGGSYNPLSVLARSISGDWDGFFFTIAARIPAQVVGSVVGVMVITLIFPKVAYGPRLKVDMNRGALTEGALTFAIVAVSLGLTKYDPRNFFLKTWIHSVSKLALQILGSDLTGGIMNPASMPIGCCEFNWAVLSISSMDPDPIKREAQRMRCCCCFKSRVWFLQIIHIQLVRVNSRVTRSTSLSVSTPLSVTGQEDEDKVEEGKGACVVKHWPTFGGSF